MPWQQYLTYTCLVKAWTALDRLSIIWKFDLSNKMKIAVLNKFLKQHPTKQQLYNHLAHLSWTIQDCKDELISNVLLWTPTHGHTSVDQPARTYISSVWTLDVVWRTCWEEWMMGINRERVSDVLSAQLDIIKYIYNNNSYLCINVCVQKTTNAHIKIINLFSSC